MTVGLGSGSTAEIALQLLGQRVRRGLRILGVPTSERVAALAREAGIPLAPEDDFRLDIDIDGADEVEKSTLNLIKGHGGALLREKIVAASSAMFVVIVDESKIVDRLGAKFALPVEVMPFGWRATARQIERLGAKVAIRHGGGDSYFLSDSGHFILDCSFGPLEDPASLASELTTIPGVVEHGLFLGMATRVLVGAPHGVVELRP